MSQSIAKGALAIFLAALIWAQPTQSRANVWVEPDCYQLDCSSQDVAYVMDILGRAAQNVTQLLQEGDHYLNIRVILTENARFDYEYRYNDEWPHVVTIGGGFIDSMYAGAIEDPQTFENFLEWALYHEIGHAVLTYLEQQQGFQVMDSDHELFSDIFATVLMLDEPDVRYAEDAAFGMLGLVVPQAEAQISAYKRRKGFPDNASSNARGDRQRRLAAAAGQAMGEHQPTEQRVDNILCMAEMKTVFDQYEQVPQPGAGCDQDLDDWVIAILDAFY